MTVSVGHCHPKVVDAMNEQNNKLQHTTTIYLTEQIGQYAEELAARMPGDLKVVAHQSNVSTRWCFATRLKKMFDFKLCLPA